MGSTSKGRGIIGVIFLSLATLGFTPQGGCGQGDQNKNDRAALLLLLGGNSDPCPGNSYSHALTIGSPGSAPGQFMEPRGLTISPDSRLYITDSSSGQVHRFALDGTYETRFGTASSSPANGDFDTPTDIAVDETGNLYVAEIGNQRIQKLDGSGSHLANIASSGTGDGQFTAPWALALFAPDQLFISDVGPERVQRLSTNGAFALKFGSNGASDGQFQSPDGMAVDQKNALIYVSSNGRIQKFTMNGEFLLRLGSAGTGDGQFSSGGPDGLAVDRVGHIYAVDPGGRRVLKFNTDGALLATLGRIGTAPGEFQSPRDVAVDNDGSVYVSDITRKVVEKFHCVP
ncbi:MAG: SMP-30/gluconolactonase/LRE family protein [Leptospiraceae bacterium]|nr:SMP-30/gluconolactonase/LRE family protein [Leptospiraceae bacterium]